MLAHDMIRIPSFAGQAHTVMRGEDLTGRAVALVERED